MKNHKIIPAVIVTVGIALLGLFIKQGIDNYSYRDRIVSVRGLAEREVKANSVTWPVVYQCAANDLNTIYTDIKTKSTAIVKFLKANGIQDSEIEVIAPSVTDNQANSYAYSTPLNRYTVNGVIVVTSNNVDLVTSLVKRQSELLKEGVAVVSGGWDNRITYDYTELNTIKPEMIAEATANAREAAKKFAEDSDSKLGKIKTASQGQFTINDRDSYTPYIKNVRVVSTITYYLED
ncbi:MAG: SIMPL domain-containing protein [Muribaculaceae bacterium]|nr:SIMPL domain-containing protein [Muribaculaceae bacterium]